MRLRFCLFVTIAALYGGCGLYGQSPAPPPTDIYANFVGNWVGSMNVGNGDHGGYTIQKLQIKITETKKNSRMRFVIVFDYDRRSGTSFLILDPTKDEMSFFCEGMPQDHYQTEGLAGFAKTGLGDFTATQTVKTHGHLEIYRGTYHLEPDSLSYTWDVSDDGKPFEKMSVVTVSREPAKKR